MPYPIEPMLAVPAAHPLAVVDQGEAVWRGLRPDKLPSEVTL
ncbi:hypothetical protein AB0H88_34660 [Nonomuraea sp. NPDC050680]